MGEYFLKKTRKFELSISYRTDGRLVQDNVTRRKMPDGFCWPTINTSDGYSSTSSGIEAVILASIKRFLIDAIALLALSKKILACGSCCTFGSGRPTMDGVLATAMRWPDELTLYKNLYIAMWFKNEKSEVTDDQ